MTPTAIQLKLNADFDALFGHHHLPKIDPPTQLPPERTDGQNGENPNE